VEISLGLSTKGEKPKAITSQISVLFSKSLLIIGMGLLRAAETQTEFKVGGLSHKLCTGYERQQPERQQ